MITIQAMALSKRIAKQIQFRYWDTGAVGDAEPIGWIARDAIEQGSREAFLFNLGEFCFIPTDHFFPNGRKSFPGVQQIFLT